MKPSPQNCAVKIIRYVAEQSMGYAKFKNRRRVVPMFIPSAAQQAFIASMAQRKARTN